MSSVDIISGCVGFDWDDGNATKNWVRHRVSLAESEQVFFNKPLLVADDLEHGGHELRYFILGQTDAKRPLFVVATVRNKLLRVISARDMTRREREAYRSHG